MASILHLILLVSTFQLKIGAPNILPPSDEVTKSAEEDASVTVTGHFNNYWLTNASIQAYRRSKFRAYENCSHLNEVLLHEYEAVHTALVQDIADETERLNVAQLMTNETARLSNSTLDNFVKKYFYFKSKYYFEINKWYYDVVFNMRNFFKDKYKYTGHYPHTRNLVQTRRILNYERDINLKFNDIAFKLRDKISSQMKSLRIRFYYYVNMILASEQREKQDFRDIIFFAMGKQEN